MFIFADIYIYTPQINSGYSQKKKKKAQIQQQLHKNTRQATPIADVLFLYKILQLHKWTKEMTMKEKNSHYKLQIWEIQKNSSIFFLQTVFARPNRTFMISHIKTPKIHLSERRMQFSPQTFISLSFSLTVDTNVHWKLTIIISLEVRLIQNPTK